MLAKRTKLLIADELERLVRDCLQQLKKMMKKKKWFHSKKKGIEVQDTADVVLTMTYPYISEGKGWTNMKTKIELDQPAPLDIVVKPQYIPDGSEDKAELCVGIKIGKERSTVRSSIWKSEGYLLVVMQ